MKLTIPYKIRAVVYIINALGAPVMAYLLIKGVIGEQEMALWTAELTAVLAMAGLNVTKPE